MHSSFGKAASRGGGDDTMVALTRKQQVDQRRCRGGENERPEKTVRLEEHEVHEPGAEGDHEREEDPSRPGVGCCLGIGDHEKREEKKGAVLEVV